MPTNPQFVKTTATFSKQENLFLSGEDESGTVEYVAQQREKSGVVDICRFAAAFQSDFCLHTLLSRNECDGGCRTRRNELPNDGRFLHRFVFSDRCLAFEREIFVVPARRFACLHYRIDSHLCPRVKKQTSVSRKLLPLTVQKNTRYGFFRNGCCAFA